jgi:Domain of unknown function (DUF4292)
VAQEKLHFFQAKSEITVEKDGKKEEFTAHIRFNLRDTLWISFTGSFGIEGARMMMTPDSTFIINKLEKTAFAYPAGYENEIIPYAFSLSDWKILLLNKCIDTINETIEEENKIWQIRYEENQIKKMYFNKSQLAQCKFNNTRNGLKCHVEFSEFETKHAKTEIAISRKINIGNYSENTVQILIKYVDYKFNQPQPFVFNFAKYKNGEL